MNTFNLPEYEQKIYDSMQNFIVIGAFDGESHDNFFHHIKNKSNNNDTKIIFVEPVSKYYKILLDKTKNISHLNIICENVGISNKEENVIMVSVKPNLLDKYGWYIEGCACVVENGQPINIYMQKVDVNDLDYENINCITFNQLIGRNKINHVDFLQIDTEGYDQRILETIDFANTDISFLKFEKHYLANNFIEKFQIKLDSLGYVAYWDNDNYYFVKKLVLDQINKSNQNIQTTQLATEISELIIPQEESDYANIAFHGSHNAAVVVEKNNQIVTVIEVERFLSVKNAGYAQYLTSFTRPFLMKEILQYIKNEYGINKYKNCYYSNTDTIEGDTKVHYEQLIPAENYINCLHHSSHAACAFYQTSYNEALIVSFDGGGSDGFFNIYHAKDRQTIELIDKFNIDLGFPYMSFGDYLNDIRLEPALNIGNLVYSGKIMGLCSYGNVNQNWLPHFEHYYKQKPDGLNYLHLLNELGEKIGVVFDRNHRLADQLSWDVAKTSQIAFENVFLEIIQPFLDKFPNLPLVLVGGCALNILLNTRLKEQLNRDVFIPPNPNDCGIATGMILSHIKPANAIDITYAGIPILDKNKLMMIIEDHYSAIPISIPILIDDLLNGKIIGIVRGNSEHGPRALGNRSIICNPMYPDMKDILNKKVKNREWYRPFAPVCRLEDVSKYFEWSEESRWMQFCPRVKEEWRSQLISITHVDNTARVQTVTREQNEWLYDLLTEFERKSGIGVLLNTSFNVNGKPILSTYEDALKVFKNTQMDKLLLENYYITSK
jgi:carbamoyltransferase